MGHHPAAARAARGCASPRPTATPTSSPVARIRAPCEAVSRWHAAGHHVLVASHRDPLCAPARPRAGCDDIGLPHDGLYCDFDKVSHCRQERIDVLIDDSPENLEAAAAARDRGGDDRSPVESGAVRGRAGDLRGRLARARAAARADAARRRQHARSRGVTRRSPTAGSARGSHPAPRTQGARPRRRMIAQRMTALRPCPNDRCRRAPVAIQPGPAGAEWRVERTPLPCSTADLARRGAAEKTRRAYAADLAQLAAWCEGQGVSIPRR